MVDFFIKLFKAFNSSQTPWQMSLAISLGMAMGLTPFSGWQSILIIFFVLIINVHIGLFLVSSAFFAGLAYMFDPLFESLGHQILTAAALESFFTSAYNTSIVRLTYFNNTLVMGSSVVAFLLLAPMYFVLNAVVYIYRDKIAAKLQQYTIFKTLGISISDKKDRFLRIWGFGVFAVLAGVVSAFVLLFLDPLTKLSLEKSLSLVSNKDVAIDDVEVSLKEGSLKIKGLDIYKDGISSLQAELIAADLDFNQVLLNRYHIEDVKIQGLKFDQKSDAQAKTASEQKNDTKEKSSKNEKISFDIDTSSLPEPQTLLSRMNLSSDKNYNKAIGEYEAIESKYKDALDKDFSKEEISSLKSDAKEIKEKLNKIKKIKSFKPEHLSLINSTLDDVKKLRKDIKQKSKKIKALKKEFKKDKELISNLSKDILQGAKKDYDNLSENYRFNKQGGMNVVGVLFGNDIKSYLDTALTYYELAKPYLKSEEEPPAPPRGEGRWIRYKEFGSSVDLLVKNVDIEGTYETNTFKANMKNISSNQELLGRAFTLNLNSNGKLSREINLGLTKLKSSDFKIDAKAKSMDYVSFLADAKLHYTNAVFSSKELKSLKEFNVYANMSKEITSPDIKVKSDLDEKLKGIFEQVIKEKLTKYKKELKELIDKNTKERLAKLGVKNKDIEKVSKLLDSSLDEYTDIDAQLGKDEKSLKSKAKGGLEDKAKDKVNDLLKSLKF
jgi:uncharacterized protein (TIGR03545 family)/uncharacterized protein (TIGR03546 family)